MAYIVADRVRDTTTTTGTGVITVAASPPLTYDTFSLRCSVNDTLPYCIVHRTVDEWEAGIATYSAANQLTRTSVLSSSNADSAVDFSAGTKDVILTQIAGRIVTGATIGFMIDGGGSAITTGIKGYLEIPFACTIQRSTLLADQTGSIVIDIWNDTYANYPPTVTDTITASAKPTLSSAIKAQDSTLTGWDTVIAAGDILGFNVDSAATVTRVSLSLKVLRT